MRVLSPIWEFISEVCSELWHDHGGKVKLFVAFFVSLAAVGFFLGRHNSPDYRDDSALQEYMARKAYKRAMTDDLVNGPYFLAYVCDARIFSYTTLDAEKVNIVAANESERVPTARRTTTFTDALILLAGGAKSDVLKLKEMSVAVFKELPKGQRAVLGLIAVVVAGSGFGIGYYYGYDARLDCKESSVQKNLNDPAFWKAVAADVREATKTVQARAH